MAARNGILLMIKQSPGITYNSLLGKTASDFGSINSARASLSRTLKDAVSFGLLKKKDNFYFITDKGNSSISFEMKNKLLMKLNTSIASPKKINELDSIVEQLHLVIEKSKNNPDLLRDARTSALFYVSDLNKMNSLANVKIKHLTYLSKILSKQIDSLKKLNFNDSVSLPKDRSSVKKISLFFSSFGLNEFFVECPETVFDLISEKFSVKSKKPNFSLKKEHLSDFFSFAFSLNYPQNESIKIYFSSIQIKITSFSINIFGPSKEIEKLVEN